MESFDVVLLTADKYLDGNHQDPLTQNVRLEDGLVAEALENEGLHIAIKSWSDPKFDWNSAKFVLVRTPWDYFERFEEFSAWFTSTATKTTFINSAALILWNSDKNYLKQLETRGIRIPQTYFIPKNATLDLSKAMELGEERFGQSCDSWVLKPCIAAGAYNTYRFDTKESGAYEQRFKKLIRTGGFMLQEFQHNIVNRGELSLMLFKGEYSHAVLKKAKLGDFRVQDDHGGTVERYQPTQNEIDFAIAVVKACNEMPLYARADIIEDNSGELALAELEIFEPELWFRFVPESAKVLAKQIVKTYFK
jgi:glutathione synthase/RimK-type ligase-like ATP-grasp enzyme